ncbi:SDR family oxidoreductase [Halomicroarcula sp. GCM10025710]
MVRTLVTGATGTLGTALQSRLTEAGHTVRAASRSPPDESTADVEWVALDLAEGTGIQSALEDVDAVIHAATAPQGDTKAVDVAGTDRLLEAAVELTSRISSIPPSSESTTSPSPTTSTSVPPRSQSRPATSRRQSFVRRNFTRSSQSCLTLWRSSHMAPPDKDSGSAGRCPRGCRLSRGLCDGDSCGSN